MKRAVLFGLSCLFFAYLRPTIPQSRVGTVCEPCESLTPNFIAQLRGVLKQRNQSVLTAQEYGSPCFAIAGYVEQGHIQVFLNPELVWTQGFHSAIPQSNGLFVLAEQVCFVADQEKTCVKKNPSLAANYTIAFSILKGFNHSLNRVL